ncbi:NADPH-dependent pterin aldehyde reductase-like isoform X2 [Dioscorea cayenensis subsp. rotundata]|uniref:NADPH-dependent pterin aldehyde reductase-like isoform X2 n=1 Tax=Dioscorea cayennensis subsp. rotundata TaxID=55577 RepID=A0AB40C3E1_DIOCR|nr:NADPH-dependent pterin aldehyde reductase-like isoform X2 [Dioscorea cayenensis subsp. rotundata]XP_039133868.1 NADPH-dependent pterin aldehyde reductase-like isoform X2 [Dioscorea cayenensis subsp. rotundata]XP_039133869.1 NADPH-dependent pterin aldehyde reductase-like isoform X2 [Dioscorea cayenensis subsp. rotundata]
MAINMRSDSSAKEFANLVAQTRRVLDIIVNNAGTINKNKKTWDVPVEEFDVVIDTNLKRVVNILSHFFPLIIERLAPYCASKWAIVGLSQSVAKEIPPNLAIDALSPAALFLSFEF